MGSVPWECRGYLALAATRRLGRGFISFAVPWFDRAETFWRAMSRLTKHTLAAMKQALSVGKQRRNRLSRLPLKSGGGAPVVSAWHVSETYLPRASFRSSNRLYAQVRRSEPTAGEPTMVSRKSASDTCRRTFPPAASQPISSCPAFTAWPRSSIGGGWEFTMGLSVPPSSTATSTNLRSVSTAAGRKLAASCSTAFSSKRCNWNPCHTRNSWAESPTVIPKFSPYESEVDTLFISILGRMRTFNPHNLYLFVQEHQSRGRTRSYRGRNLIWTDIPQITSKFVEIVPRIHRQGNCTPPPAGLPPASDRGR